MQQTVEGAAESDLSGACWIGEIVNGRRGLNADTSLRLSRYFGSTPEFWINLQSAYDLSITIDASADRIEREVRPRKAA